MSGIRQIKQLASTRYEEESFLAYLDMMKRLAVRAELPEQVLLAFVLNGLPDDVGGLILLYEKETLTWAYLYSACEGLDCSNRGYSMLGGSTRFGLNEQQTEVMKVSEQKKIKCFFCGKAGHFKEIDDG